MLLIYCDNSLNRFHAFVQLFGGIKRIKRIFSHLLLLLCALWEVVNCLESLRLSPKSCSALVVVISAILKYWFRFGNKCAFYFEIYFEFI